MRLWFVLIYFILALGCASTVRQYTYTHRPLATNVTVTEIPVYIDKDFSAKDISTISAAIDEWNYVLNGMIALKVVDTKFDMQPSIIKKVLSGEGYIILRIDSSSPLVHDTMDSYTLAWVDKIHGHVMHVVRDRLTPTYLRSVVLHEIGHLLGAVHRPLTLMAAQADIPFPCVDGQTALQVAATYMLPIAEMNYCVPMP